MLKNFGRSQHSLVILFSIILSNPFGRNTVGLAKYYPNTGVRMAAPAKLQCIYYLPEFTKEVFTVILTVVMQSFVFLKDISG